MATKVTLRVKKPHKDFTTDPLLRGLGQEMMKLCNEEYEEKAIDFLKLHPEVVNYRNKKGNSILMIACLNKMDKLIKDIIAIAPALIIQKGHKNITPLWVVKKQKKEYLIDLFYRTMPQDYIDDKGQSLMMILLKERRECDYLIHDEIKNLNHMDEHGATAFITAVNCGRPDVAEKLLRFDHFDMGQRGTQNYAPLFLVSLYGYPQLIKIMLETKNVNPREKSVRFIGQGTAIELYAGGGTGNQSRREGKVDEEIFRLFVETDRKMHGSCGLPLGNVIRSLLGVYSFSRLDKNIDYMSILKYLFRELKKEPNENFNNILTHDKPFGYTFTKLNRDHHYNPTLMDEIFLTFLLTGWFKLTPKIIAQRYPNLVPSLKKMPNLTVDFGHEVSEVVI